MHKLPDFIPACSHHLKPLMRDSAQFTCILVHPSINRGISLDSAVESQKFRLHRSFIFYLDGAAFLTLCTLSCVTKRLRVFVSFLILSSVGLAQQAVSKPDKSNLQWDEMVWISLPVGDRVVEKAVLAINVGIEGLQRALMQLDLGTYQTIVYGAPYNALGGRTEASQASRISVSGTVAGLRIQAGNFLLDRNHGIAPKAGEPVELGTIGADFFNNRILLLDFVRDKVAIVNKSNFPHSVETQVSFAPLQYRDGKVFVSVRIGGRDVSGFFYDTGSSALPLVTTRERWSDLTGRKPDDPANEVWTVKSWGKDAALIGARLPGSLCIGAACIDSPMIYFERSGLENLRFDKYKFPANGLIGNAIFMDQYSVVVDLASQRLGLMKGSLSDRR